MKKILLFFPVLFFWTACSFDKAEVPVVEFPCDSMSYSANIAPLMASACNSCHVPLGGGTGDFSDYPDLKLAADNGSLKQAVFTQKSMPPAGSPGITDEERSKIKCWIEQGAPNN
jgi:uncharacterized membrane protein